MKSEYQDNTTRIFLWSVSGMQVELQYCEWWDDEHNTPAILARNYSNDLGCRVTVERIERYTSDGQYSPILDPANSLDSLYHSSKEPNKS